MSNIESLLAANAEPTNGITDCPKSDERVVKDVLVSGVLDLQPTLVGKTITLRPITLSDCEELYLAASDPLIWELHPDPLRYQRDVFQRNFLEGALASKSAFVAIENASQKIIGSSRYYDLDETNREIAIGFTFLVRKHWGGATNAEMKSLLLKHAFHHVNTVWFHVGIQNWRSRRAMEKIGGVFTHEGVRVINGNASEHAYYKIVAADFAKA